MLTNHLSLFKKGVIYYVQYTDADGRRRQKTTGVRSKPEAMRILADFRTFLEAAPKKVLLSDFTQELVTSGKSQYAQKTILKQDGTLKTFQRSAGNRALHTFTARDVDRYKSERLQVVKPVSVNCELRTLRAAFNIARRWGYLRENPFSKVRFAQIPEQTPAFFTKSDFQALLNAIEETWFKEIVLFATLTGMRRGEVVNLKWEHVDFERKMIHVESTDTFKTKQGKRRGVPLNDVCFALLQNIRARSCFELVFHKRGAKLYEDGLSHLLKVYIRKLKLPEKLHFHSLRHSFASWLAQSNVSIYTLKELLGHTDVKTTQVYSHLVSSEMHDVVNKIEVSLN